MSSAALSATEFSAGSVKSVSVVVIRSGGVCPKGHIRIGQLHPSSSTQHSGGSQKASPLRKTTIPLAVPVGVGGSEPLVLEQKILTSANSKTSSLELRRQTHASP